MNTRKVDIPTTKEIIIKLEARIAKLESKFAGIEDKDKLVDRLVIEKASQAVELAEEAKDNIKNKNNVFGH